MMGYTPVFGSSVKYVLLGKKEVCSPPRFATRKSGQLTRLGFVPDSTCVVRAARSLTVTSGRRTLGAVTVDRGRSALLVPAYEFTFHSEPAQPGRRDHTVSVAAVDDATLTRVARESR